MDDIYTYIVPLPVGVDEVVVPCAEGHTVYIADRLDQPSRVEKYKHAVRHIVNRDFGKVDVQEIELDAHEV